MRKLVVLLLALSLAFSLAGVACAQDAETGSLIERVREAQEAGGGAIKDEVDRIGFGIVDFVRGIFAVIAVVFVIWAGFVFWGAGGNPEALMRAKKLAAGFIVCIIGVYSAETIVGGILGLLGYGS